MSGEGQNRDFNSLGMLTKKNPDWLELAKTCVCFANAQGGQVLIGIEDGQQDPPAGQKVDPELLTAIHRRVGELTVNVTIAVEINVSSITGGEYLEVTIARSASPASTTDGRFYHRVGDACKPLIGEDIQRLLNERNAQPWETLTSLGVPRNRVDPDLLAAFIVAIRGSDRVKESVKEKTEDELLDHYLLAIDSELTNLGILCVGRREDRARLGSAPAIQCIRYDAEGRKINKTPWDDHTRSPMQLVDSVWRNEGAFQETYEIPDGLFRQQVPAFDERVVRELLVNAIAHRPYTQRGDIYLNLYPDRLEIVNPGLLPLGVTPQNILHQSVRRNPELARVFHDLKLMEREGSGFDLLYEVLLSQGRPVPQIREGTDRVEVTVEKQIVKAEVIDFLAKADKVYQLRQREKITLGLLAQRDAMSARELCTALELSDVSELSPWLGRLLKLDIVRQTGKTKGTRYFVTPKILRDLEFPAQTSLARIEPHRLDALVQEDVRRYPGSSIGEIHERIGPEVDRRKVKSALDRLCEGGQTRKEGEKRGRRYWPGEQ
ncbi:putative DNA binding domain-containing protein [Aeoliella sp. ICT_H6.2]|uniref:DNA binding domain-containing protein n=1 Tax=Aeoliella straminimaris TaxID=2954799 RepID=A0A9X2FHD8_9BACT|nr:ATP-binding protein [Aeoliella straminimaris]MCO6045921.1 putative DNA binding domain-containing protein [Aeoliella straminimaris]